MAAYEPKSESRPARFYKKMKKSDKETHRDRTPTLSYVIEKIQDGYYEVDLSGNLEKFNEALRKMIGLDKNELIGLNYKKYIDPEDTEKVFKTFNQVYQTGIPSQAFDWRILRKDGTVRYLETSVSLKRNKTGRPDGFFGIARDVTQARITDRALRDSEMLYRSFLESSPDPIVIYDMDGITKYVNHAFETTFGWSQGELLGKRIDFVPPENVQETKEAIQQLKDGKVVTLFETRRFTKKREILDVQLSSATFLDPLGSQTGVIVILRDITELKRTRSALAESESKFSTLIQESPYGISIINRLGTYQYFNRKFTEIFGYTLEDIPDGKTWFSLAFPDVSERKRAVSIWKSEHQTWVPGETKPYTRKVRCKNGGYKIICFRPVIMPNGHYFISYEDITERETAKKKLVRAHKELKKNLENLKSIERIKEKAIDHICHEIKTPIAIIDAVFRILSKSPENKVPDNFTELIERGQRYLQRLKNIQIQMDDIVLYSRDGEHDRFSDLLENFRQIRESLNEKNLSVENVLYLLFDKIESMYGRKDEIVEKIDLADLIADQIKDLHAFCSTRNLNILNKAYHNTIIYMDRRIIEKTVNGLLKNAIENTPDGGVVVLKTRENRSEIRVEIMDFGVGITEENQKNLFWGFFHTQDTKHYSTKKPCEFNAGGCGGDLLRMKLFADRCGFSISFKSRRCKYIPLSEQFCPGSIAKCGFIRSSQDCMKSGGSKFILAFPKEKFLTEPRAFRT
jgi:PAS domain S-box-containing protein